MYNIYILANSEFKFADLLYMQILCTYMCIYILSFRHKPFFRKTKPQDQLLEVNNLAVSKWSIELMKN